MANGSEKRNLCILYYIAIAIGNGTQMPFDKQFSSVYKIFISLLQSFELVFET